MSVEKRQRKPIHLEQKGGKSNRQRVWEAIRQQRDKFSLHLIAEVADVNYDTVQTYLGCLKKAGIIAHILKNDEKSQNAFAEEIMYLVRDCGIEAPQLRKDGTPCTTGLGTEAMWRTLRILGSVTADELAVYASASAPTTKATAQTYLKWLFKAGYVRRSNTRPPHYSLVLTKVTGPRAPQIQRIGQVYDPNTATVVYAQTPEDLL